MRATCFMMVVLAASSIGAPAALAQSKPDGTVHCTINRASFWTVHGVCDALIAEAGLISSKIGTEPETICCTDARAT